MFSVYLSKRELRYLDRWDVMFVCSFTQLSVYVSKSSELCKCLFSVWTVFVVWMFVPILIFWYWYELISIVIPSQIVGPHQSCLFLKFIPYMGASLADTIAACMFSTLWRTYTASSEENGACLPSHCPYTVADLISFNRRTPHYHRWCITIFILKINSSN